MLAIMGPSGAGKTTLLSLICMRNSPNLTVKGEVNFQISRFWPIVSNSVKNLFTTLGPTFIRMTSFKKLSLLDVLFL